MPETPIEWPPSTLSGMVGERDDTQCYMKTSPHLHLPSGDGKLLASARKGIRGRGPPFTGPPVTSRLLWSWEVSASNAGGRNGGLNGSGASGSAPSG